jgi:hypothetical protein
VGVAVEQGIDGAGVARQGAGRQAGAEVDGAVLVDVVGDAVLVGAGVARQGAGGHGGAEVDDAVLVDVVGDAVLVGVGIGTHGEVVSVGEAVLDDEVALVGSGVV